MSAATAVALPLDDLAFGCFAGGIDARAEARARTAIAELQHTRKIKDFPQEGCVIKLV